MTKRWWLTPTALFRSHMPPVFLEPRHWLEGCWPCASRPQQQRLLSSMALAARRSNTITSETENTMTDQPTIARLPYAADLPLPAYQSDFAAGLDSTQPSRPTIRLFSRPAPKRQSQPGSRCTAAGDRRACPRSALRPPRRYCAQYARHDRRRLLRRGLRRSHQPRPCVI
jgi:hypothetical protein